MAAPYLLLALGPAAIEVAWAVRSPQPVLVESFHDDAFYYFEIARNLADGLGSTFDGLTPTNGYHPLWLLVLTPIYALVSDPIEALVWIKALTALFWIASIGLAYRIAAELSSPVEMIPSLILLVYLREFWFFGMETAVLLPLLFLLVLLSLRWRVFSQSLSPRRSLSLGAVLGGVLLARLDTVFLASIYCAAFALTRPATRSLRERARSTLWLASPPVATLAVYTGFNLLWLGTATPVSGQAKSLGGPFFNLEIFEQAFFYRPITALFLREVPAGALLALALGAALWLLHRSRKTVSPESWESTACWLLLALTTAFLVRLLYYTITSSWTIWTWYLFPFPVIFLLASTVALRLARNSSVRESFYRVAAPRTSLLLMLVVALLLVRAELYWRNRQPSLDENYRLHSSGLASWLNAETPSNAVLAMGDRAGAIAYQLERPLIQLEGLVESPEYLRALKEGRVHPFLEAHGVRYFIYSGGVRSGGAPRPLPATPGCQLVVEPKFGEGPKVSTVVCDEDRVYHVRLEADSDEQTEGALSVWRYRPQSDVLQRPPTQPRADRDVGPRP